MVCRILSLLISMLVCVSLYGVTNSVPSTNRSPVPAEPRVPLRLLEESRYRYRNPFLAGLLSSTMWGAGQIYCGEYKKGSLLVFGDLVYKGLLIGLIIKFNNKYSTGSQDSVSWSDFSSADKGLVIGYAITWIGISLLSISDAVASAHRFNKINDIRKQFSLGLSSDQGRPSFSLGWNMTF